MLDKSLRVPGGRTLQVLVLCRMNTVVVTLVLSHMPKHVGRDGPLTGPIGVQCTMLCMCVKGHIVFSKQRKANSEHAEYTDPHLAKQYDMHGTANSCSAKIFLVFKKGIVTASTLVNNSAIESNATGGDGGALFLDGGTTWLGNNTFVGNNAGTRGGAVAYMHACFQIPDVPGKLSSVGCTMYVWVQSNQMCTLMMKMNAITTHIGCSSE